MPALKSLILDKTNVGDEQIHAISELDLHFLGLKVCRNITEKGFDDLGRMKHLNQLDIKDTNYPKETIQPFKNRNPNAKIQRRNSLKKRAVRLHHLPLGKVTWLPDTKCKQPLREFKQLSRSSRLARSFLSIREQCIATLAPFDLLMPQCRL